AVHCEVRIATYNRRGPDRDQPALPRSAAQHRRLPRQAQRNAVGRRAETDRPPAEQTDARLAETTTGHEALALAQEARPSPTPDRQRLKGRDSMAREKPLQDKRILMFVDDVYEDLELWYPKLRMIEAGAQVIVAGPEMDRKYSGKHGYPCQADEAIVDME